MNSLQVVKGSLVLTRAEVRVVVLAIAAFVLVTVDVAIGGLLTHLDDGIRDQLIGHAVNAPGVLSPLGVLGNLGVAIPVVFAAAAVSCQVTWRLWPAGFAVVTFGVAEVLVVVVKAIVGRPGPGVWADRDGYPGYFPSGHAATAMVATGIVVFLAMVVPRGSRRRGQASLASLVAGLVVGSAAGAYAIVGDYHWTSDVVGSIALTAPVLVVAGAVVRTRIYAAESVGHAR